ncbi:amidohydrolase [Melampsora larici-populina 98AG31]|uniref:Peptidase M20 domain-containing protein 2 n=1 Tax=Melampsora larici-populina (strain 98AG31 / pathotype 3-4-7) TaxID=747676 RepID=F4S368_MELLP|nr:amidohydrolase [Melampsora larici-populina 98AG31]EGG00930.1 amidohydrolase [Melampsora larici-populina 98AG31]
MDFNPDREPPAYSALSSSLPTNDEYLSIIEQSIDNLSNDLRTFSLKMFEYAETAMKEYHTHDLLADFMSQQSGWKVTRHAYGMETAVEAVFSRGSGGPTIGFNSEMDALPQIGHACGHPLICISGIAAAIATATALTKASLPGTVILLGTPAEEDIGGKLTLIDRGAYKPMDACLMLHPAPFGGLLGMFAITEVIVEYHGKNAHAAGAPWEGVNALDAAVAAYTSISTLRQQIHPTHRVHGIIQGSERWTANVIPDYACLKYGIRAPTSKEMLELKERVFNCFKAAALSTGCTYTLKEELVYYDLKNNSRLGTEYKHYMESVMKIPVPLTGPVLGSTDFGNVSYKVPAIHPIYEIPTKPGEGNHTRGFTTAAATEEAHELTLKSAKGIAFTGWKVLSNPSFLADVRREFNLEICRT